MDEMVSHYQYAVYGRQGGSKPIPAVYFFI